MKKIRLFFKYLYGIIYWEDCEELTLWEYFYQRRIGFGTAWRTAKYVSKSLKK